MITDHWNWHRGIVDEERADGSHNEAVVGKASEVSIGGSKQKAAALPYALTLWEDLGRVIHR